MGDITTFGQNSLNLNFFFNFFYLQNKRQEHTLSTLNNSKEKSNKNKKEVRYVTLIITN